MREKNISQPHGANLPDVSHTDLKLVRLSTLEAGAAVVGVEVMFQGAALGAVKCDVYVGVSPGETFLPRLHGNLKHCQRGK